MPQAIEQSMFLFVWGAVGEEVVEYKIIFLPF